MNHYEYYNRQKVSWEENELNDIRTEYESKQLTISEIADIHRRTPGSISYKLQKLGIISHYTLARGYDVYKISHLYKEIVTSGKRSDSDKKLKKEIADTSSKEKIDQINTLEKDVSELKTEIKSIKKDVKEILRLMNALYDFESRDDVEESKESM